MATTSPALAEYEKHAEKFGSAMVMETASMNGFTTLAHLQLRLFEAAVGRTFDVLIDASSRRREWELSGRTSGNTVVNLPGPREWIGRITAVAIRRAGPNSLWGEPIATSA